MASSSSATRPRSTGSAPASATSVKQRRPVGVADLAGPERRRPRPVRRRSTARRPAAGDGRRRRPRPSEWQHAEVAGGQHRARRGPRRRRAARRRPPGAPTGPGSNLDLDQDAVAVAGDGRVLDHHHGVGSGRDRRAGHDPHRLARPDRDGRSRHPRRSSPSTASVAGRPGPAPAVSAARTAKPSTAVLANGGIASADSTSSAATHPTTSSTATGLRRQRADPVEHVLARLGQRDHRVESRHELTQEAAEVRPEVVAARRPARPSPAASRACCRCRSGRALNR